MYKNNLKKAFSMFVLGAVFFHSLTIQEKAKLWFAAPICVGKLFVPPPASVTIDLPSFVYQEKVIIPAVIVNSNFRPGVQQDKQPPDSVVMAH
jgi:hypothetical protein